MEHLFGGKFLRGKRWQLVEINFGINNCQSHCIDSVHAHMPKLHKHSLVPQNGQHSFSMESSFEVEAMVPGYSNKLSGKLAVWMRDHKYHHLYTIAMLNQS